MLQKIETLYVLCDCVDFDCGNIHWPCVRAMQLYYTKVNQVGRVVGCVAMVLQCVRACVVAYLVMASTWIKAL